MEFIINVETFSIQQAGQKRVGNQVKLGNVQSILASETRTCLAWMKTPGVLDAYECRDKWTCKSWCGTLNKLTPTLTPAFLRILAQ